MCPPISMLNEAAWSTVLHYNYNFFTLYPPGHFIYLFIYLYTIHTKVKRPYDRKDREVTCRSRSGMWLRVFLKVLQLSQIHQHEQVLCSNPVSLGLTSQFAQIQSCTIASQPSSQCPSVWSRRFLFSCNSKWAFQFKTLKTRQTSKNSWWVSKSKMLYLCYNNDNA